MEKKPRFEKTDNHTLKIIMEKSADIPLTQLLNNKKVLEEEIKKQTATLKNVIDMIAEAKKLGITPAPVVKDAPKK